MRPKGSADVLEDRRRRALKLLNDTAKRRKFAAASRGCISAKIARGRSHMRWANRATGLQRATRFGRQTRCFACIFSRRTHPSFRRITSRRRDTLEGGAVTWKAHGQMVN